MGVDFANFQLVFDWVIANGYLFIFLAMCMEGPMTTTAAGLAAALGYLNPWIVLIISILGDLVPDTIYYLIGYVGRLTVIKKIGYRLGLTEARILRLEELLRKNFVKTMIILKFMPVVTVVGFMLVGYLRLSFRKFMNLCSAITIPKSIILLSLGYFFGKLYNVSQFLHNAKIFIPIAILVVLAVYIGYKKISTIIGRRIGNV